MYKRVVSCDVLHRVLKALDKNFPFIDWSITARKDDKDRTILLLCWRVLPKRRPYKTIIFSFRSRPLSCIPLWACYAIIYRFEKAKQVLRKS